MNNSFLIMLVLSLFLTSCSLNRESNLTSYISTYETIQKENKSNSHWHQFEPSKLKKHEENITSFLNELKSLDDNELSIDDGINKDLLMLIATDELEGLKFKIHQFPLNAEGGFLTGIMYNIYDTRVTNDKEEKDYFEKLDSLPYYIDVRINHLKSSIESGNVSPKLIAEICLGMVEEVIQSDPEATFFVEPVKGTKLESDVVQLVKAKIVPAYQKLSNFLKREYIPNAQEDIGIRSIPDGKAYYEHRVRYFATDQITPQEVFDIGMREVKRIRKEMETVIEEVEFDGSFEDFQVFLRTDPQFYAKSPQDILNRAAWITKQIEGELPKYFNKLPSLPLTVKPVPEAIAPNYTSGRYSEGSWERKVAGEYWVNTTKLESRPLYALPALSLHEGVPGHHTQIMLAAEMDVPEFRKNTYLSAFGEGWALYCEYLGKEAGIYTTHYEDYGRLVYEMWRACRLVVDPGMHYFGWSREKAFDFMKTNTALSILEIDNEINRYIGWPGQAISYKLGELKIKELRKYSESELGSKFDISTFHDKILSNGSVPLNTLERIIKDWVKNQKSQ
jgi:uncharacterized protein (DUF885 family)